MGYSLSASERRNTIPNFAVWPTSRYTSLAASNSHMIIPATSNSSVFVKNTLCLSTPIDTTLIVFVHLERYKQMANSSRLKLCLPGFTLLFWIEGSHFKYSCSTRQISGLQCTAYELRREIRFYKRCCSPVAHILSPRPDRCDSASINQ